MGGWWGFQRIILLCRPFLTEERMSSFTYSGNRIAPGDHISSVTQTLVPTKVITTV